MTVVDPKLVEHIAILANIPVSDAEAVKLADGFTTTLGVVENLNSIDTSGVAITNQVTGLENIFRNDVVTPERTFTQAQALQNAKRTHNGYIVVDQLIGE